MEVRQLELKVVGRRIVFIKKIGRVADRYKERISIERLWITDSFFKVDGAKCDSIICRKKLLGLGIKNDAT